MLQQASSGYPARPVRMAAENRGRPSLSGNRVPIALVIVGGITALTLGTAFGLLALDAAFFWVAFPVGFGVVLPIALGVVGLWPTIDE